MYSAKCKKSPEINQLNWYDSKMQKYTNADFKSPHDTQFYSLHIFCKLYFKYNAKIESFGFSGISIFCNVEMIKIMHQLKLFTTSPAAIAISLKRPSVARSFAGVSH